MKKYKILIVDDDRITICMIACYLTTILSEVVGKEIIRLSVSELMSAINDSFVAWDGILTIDVSQDVESAIYKISNNTYDVITLDGDLSCGKHGRDILKMMDSNQKQTVVVYSGDSTFVKEAEAQNIHAMNKESNNRWQEILTSMGIIQS